MKAGACPSTAGKQAIYPLKYRHLAEQVKKVFAVLPFEAPAAPMGRIVFGSLSGAHHKVRYQSVAPFWGLVSRISPS